MELDEPGVLADRNLAASWAGLGRHAGFAVEHVDALTLTSSGLPTAFFNSGFLHGALSDPEAVVAAAMAFYAQREVPYLLWAREGVDDAFLEAGGAAGLRDAGGPPAMLMAPIAAPPPRPDGLDISMALGAAEVEEHRHVVAGGFGMPIEAARRLVATSIVDDRDFAIVVGRVDGVPVTTALLSRHGDTAGVYNVATLEGHRGKGYGAAATWAVVTEGARRGCTHSVLQSSDAGHPVYRAMGFVDIGRYVQLEGPPA